MHKSKLKSLQNEKIKFYENFVLGQIDIDVYKNRKTMIYKEIASADRICNEYEKQIEQRYLTQNNLEIQKTIISEIENTECLTKSLVDLLIKGVYVFPDKHIEIEYTIKDLFE